MTDAFSGPRLAVVAGVLVLLGLLALVATSERRFAGFTTDDGRVVQVEITCGSLLAGGGLVEVGDPTGVEVPQDEGLEDDPGTECPIDAPVWRFGLALAGILVVAGGLWIWQRLGPRKGPGSAAALVLAVLLLAGCGGEDAGGAVEQSGSGFLGKATVAGDSISYGIGAVLREEVDPRVEVKVISEGSTGLARPDEFDWPTRLEALATDFPPEVLVFSVGSNDHQDLTDGTGKVVAPFADEAAWETEYSRRLAEVFDHFTDTGTTVVWVGQMHSEDPLVGVTNRRIHRLAVEVAEDRPGVTVSDLGEWLGSGEEPATSCLEPDGVHLNEGCNRRAAEAVATEVDGLVAAPG